jgi:tRNA pseudouridine55 synthase
METPTVLLVDKPSQMTSFGLVARVRRIVGVKKAGHAGTLDPAASGLMLVGLGSGTKELTALTKLDKEYVAEVLIGQKRTTGDMEGDVVEEKEVLEIFSDEKISSTLATLLGTHTYPVSAYSAIKRDGVPMYKRAYEAAKKGETVTDVPLRSMRVDEVELLRHVALPLDEKKFLLVTVRFAVGSGTYIRSLVEEFGRLLGYPSTLYNLRRTQIGEFRIENATTLEALATTYGVPLF